MSITKKTKKSSNKSSSKSSKSSSKSNNNSSRKEKCVSTYCENVFPKKLEKLKKKISKNIIPKMTKNMIPSHKKIFIKNFNKSFFIKDKKTKEWEKQNCKNSFCNPKCKNTLFQEGTKIPKEVFKNAKLHLTHTIKDPKLSAKAYKDTVKIFKKMRQHIYGEKTNVLKNDFYEKLPLKTVNKLKKEGAISGCSLSE